MRFPIKEGKRIFFRKLGISPIYFGESLNCRTGRASAGIATGCGAFACRRTGRTSDSVATSRRELNRRQ